MGIPGDCVFLDRSKRGGCGIAVMQGHGGHH